jgi:hypothetical protein
MTDIAVVAANVAPTRPDISEIYDFVAGEAIGAGQTVYQRSDGRVGVGDTNVAGKQQIRGIAMTSVPAGIAVSCLKRGPVAGYVLTQAYDAQVFASDTAGAIADAVGTMPVPLGRVVGVTDNPLTKLIYFDIPWDVQRV